jgi:predicted aspartyl protease
MDTGFSGYLTLPRHVIDTLGLGFLTSRVYKLGDNSEVNFDVYLCVALLDGDERNCMVLASEAFPLVGMALLKGYRLTVDVIDGGEVRIERRK